MFLLVKNAADNSTTKTGLKIGNLISTDDLLNAIDSTFQLYINTIKATFSALPM